MNLNRMKRADLEVEARRHGIDPATLTVPELRAKIVEAQDAAGDPDPFAQLEDEQAGRDDVAPAAADDGEVVDATVVEDADPAEHPPSTELAPANEDAARDAFRVMALADEEQIVDELQGRALDVMVYSFPMDGKPTTGLSWKGVREVVRTLNARGYTRLRIDQAVRPVFEEVVDHDDEPAWQVSVYAEDTRNGGGNWGVAIQPKRMTLKNGSKKPDPFAKTKALSKAQRNAYEALLPAELVEALKAQYMGAGKVKRLPGTVSTGGDDRPPPLTDDHAKDQAARCRAIYDEIKRLNRMLVPPGMFNRLMRGAEHDHGRMDDLIAHLESLRDQEAEVQLLVAVLADGAPDRSTFDEWMKRVDRAGSAGQSQRLKALRDLVDEHGLADKVEAAQGAAEGKGEDGEAED